MKQIIRKGIWSIILIVLLLGGCGGLKTLAAYYKSNVGELDANDIIIERLPYKKYTNGDSASLPKDAVKLINEFAIMALFSKVVYRKDLNKGDRKKACSTCLNFGMPKGKDGQGWFRMHSIKKTPTCYNKNGLFYETYAYRSSSESNIETAVIAIRGTENSWTQFLPDWSANIGNVLGFKATEYEVAKQRIPELIEKIKKNNHGIKIYVTGHSLGGGLAQQTAFLVKKGVITATYVFDSSPVTNWSNLVLDKEIKNSDPIIKRISHRGEVLGGIRGFSAKFNVKRFGRSDYEFYFQKSGSAVDNHEIGILACHMAVRMNFSNQEYFYPKSFVKSMLEERGICKPPKKEEKDFVKISKKVMEVFQNK